MWYFLDYKYFFTLVASVLNNAFDCLFTRPSSLLQCNRNFKACPYTEHQITIFSPPSSSMTIHFIHYSMNVGAFNKTYVAAAKRLCLWWCLMSLWIHNVTVSQGEKNTWLKISYFLEQKDGFIFLALLIYWDWIVLRCSGSTVRLMGALCLTNTVGKVTAKQHEP